MTLPPGGWPRGWFLLLVITCVSKLRKGSSAALWSQCSSFVLQWRFKNIRIILLLLYFFFFIYPMYILIRPSMCFFYNSFRSFLLNIVVLTISYEKKEKQTRMTWLQKSLMSVQKMYISFECCLSFAEVHFGSINLQKESFNKHFFLFHR